KTVAPDALRKHTQVIECGGRMDLMTTLRRWSAMGYESVTAVEVPGTMSRRGGIIDVFPPTRDLPVRIELFGDMVESIRSYDPATQRSADAIQRVTVPPASEFMPHEDGGSALTLSFNGSDEAARERMSEDLRKLSEGEPFEEAEFYRGLVATATVLDYLPAGGLLVLDEPMRIRQALDDVEAQAEELRQRLSGQGEMPDDLPIPFERIDDPASGWAKRGPRLEMESFSGDEGSPFSAAPSYSGRTRVMLKEVKEMLSQGQRLIMVSHQAPRLAELLEEAEVFASPTDGLLALPPPGGIALVHGSLAEGWTLADQGLTLLTDAELFGLAKQHRRARRRPVQRQAFLSELTPGDHVVHLDHGIARFAGMLVRKVDEREREYLVLEYAAGDRVLVPSDQIDRVGPYVGVGEREPKLTRLGTQEWHRLKRRVKASAEKVARDLLSLYAAREVVAGRAFSEDSPWQQEMESAFPYIETPDQLRAIQEVKEDMERPKPMDRVITGDVGYGKTEVALRAAFKAVMEGTQVAILVPTTVLAQQHLTTFRERLAPFPLQVEMLSRFRTDKQQAEVVKGLSDGSVDIVIGTHRLLQKDIRFKDLGLVVIDEEQRFGVAHKERLKELRREVDVLSMSATPIPRTLYMSLAGVRDMSVMETPPEERLPIKTYVTEYNKPMIREAILREMERGGQIFFVHNRVRSIGIVAEQLAKLVPEAKVLVGHGQMPEHRLEQVMLDFAAGEADVLLCTTIIESGLDMPNVNTLIVSDSDRMGLSQLYQLRGRVGRGANRAYAYFFYSPERNLTETAEKRLKTILSATELGAGFRIAMKDLEIRGAGNILGVEQHGQIATVGFDLYVRLLGEAVEELKAGMDGTPIDHSRRQPGPSVDLPVPARIPESYIGHLASRLAVYQRMALLREPTEVDDLANELKDRYGDWPEAVEDLLFLLKVKLLAQKAGVLSVSTESGQVVLTGDERTWTNLLGVRRPYGDGVRVGNTRVRLDIKKLGKRWRQVLQAMLIQAGGHGERVEMGVG
ncbi:MAG: transcription-repair coupling factor, partial [Chloroflexi bacterium]|nr:transcription-repair coupling factor [Chloroflexota bacterium]